MAYQEITTEKRLSADRILVSVFILASCVVLPGSLLFPAIVTGCVIANTFWRSAVFWVILQFMIFWIAFFLMIGAARYFSGTSLSRLLVDASSGMGLALGVAFSAMLLATESPETLLITFDKIKVPRTVSYAILSLLRLLSEINNIASRQLSLLRVKNIKANGIIPRFIAYRRILGPMFSVLFTHQLAHARGLEQRGFFATNSIAASQYKIKITNKGMLLLIIANAAAWTIIGLWVK